MYTKIAPNFCGHPIFKFRSGENKSDLVYKWPDLCYYAKFLYKDGKWVSVEVDPVKLQVLARKQSYTDKAYFI